MNLFVRFGAAFVRAFRGGKTRSLALQLQGFLDRAPVGLAVFDGQGRTLQRSRSLSTLLPPGETRFPESLEPRLTPAAWNELRQAVRRAASEGTETEGEWQFGGETWHLNLFPLDRGQLGLIAQDLTRRVNTEQELIASRTQLNQIIELSPVGIAVADLSSGLCLRSNRKFTETYGYRLEDLPTLARWFERVYPDPVYRSQMRSQWMQAIEENRRTGTPVPSLEVRLTGADGVERSALISTALVGNLSVVTFVDRTEQKKAEKALSDLNRSLEEKVRSRTEELEQTYRDLADTEKLAALGQLAAGMAHELNTPLGAIQAANRVIQDFWNLRLGALLAFAAGQDPADQELLVQLTARNRNLATSLPPAPDRLRRKAMMAALEDRHLDAEEETAEYLIELGWTDSDLDLWASQPGAWQTVLWCRDLLTLQRMTTVIGDGGEKAAHVVDALRRYLKGSEEAELVRIPVADQLETILTLFHHKMKHSIEVVRDYAPGAQVVGDRHRLNQVWMNLIHNALQAMDYRGTLSLSVQVGNGTLRVGIGDSGTGIPEEIRNRIFAPYFTTKKKGEGLGLGLDLCRKIVEDHQGSITFESRPGSTVFTVALPSA